jgi:uncharacterized SAM-dependent methyltransferase
MFGLSIVNMKKQDTQQFLSDLSLPMKSEDMVTFDLKKSYKMIEMVYDDPQGVSE